MDKNAVSGGTKVAHGEPIAAMLKIFCWFLAVCYSQRTREGEAKSNHSILATEFIVAAG